MTRAALSNPAVTDFVRQTVEYEDRLADELLANAGVIEIRMRVELPPEIAGMVRRLRKSVLEGSSAGPLGRKVAEELASVVAEQFADDAEKANRGMFEEKGVKVPSGIRMRPIPVEQDAVKAFALRAFLSQLTDIDLRVSDLLKVEKGTED